MPIRPLAWELPYAMGAALEKTKRKKRKNQRWTCTCIRHSCTFSAHSGASRADRMTDRYSNVQRRSSSSSARESVCQESPQRDSGSPGLSDVNGRLCDLRSMEASSWDRLGLSRAALQYSWGRGFKVPLRAVIAQELWALGQPWTQVFPPLASVHTQLCLGYRLGSGFLGFFQYDILF